MTNNKKLLLAITAFLIVVNQLPLANAAPAEGTGKTKTKATAQAPIVIEADKLYYSEQTGDYSAQGQVHVTKDTDQVFSQELKGNTRNGEVRAENSATLLQPGISLTGHNIQYNYQNRTGEIEAVNGKIEKIFVGGKAVSLQDGQVIVHDGTLTGCPAEKPHYYLSADRVEIWPGNKLIAYKARVVVGKVTLFSLPKFEKSLKDHSETTILPRIGYDSDDGFMIGQYISVPAGKQTTVYTDLRYYTERGFEPTFGITNEGKSYTLDAFHGSEKNTDDEWIEKEQEYRLKLNPYKLGNMPVHLQFTASSGKWTEGSVSGWRQGYEAYLQSDSFKLSDTVSLQLGAGYENVYYGYNKTNNDILRVDANLKWDTKRADSWLGYSYRHQTALSVYNYDRIDIPRELRAGFLYQIDDKNKLGMSVKYDLDRSKPEELKYTWRHTMHCIETDISYETKEDRLSLKLAVLNF